MTTWTDQTKNAGNGSSFFFLIDNTNFFLIDNTNKLIISDGGDTIWTDQNKS